jgi:hypothetical protein
VKSRLRAIDTTDNRFFSIAEHPVLGSVHLEHLTLAELADHYPDVFDKFGSYRSMAIVREPMDRFLSAIFQRMREFRGERASEITPDKVEREARMIIDHLNSRPKRLAVEYVHFNRQSDYIEHGGARVVKDVFSIERMADVADYLRRHTGVEIGEERHNRTTQLNRWLRPLQRMLRAPYVRLFPREFRSEVRRKMVGIGLYHDAPTQQHIHRDSPIYQFVREHYARDFDIYEQACAYRARGETEAAVGADA